MFSQLSKRPLKNFLVAENVAKHPNGTYATEIAKETGLHLASTVRSLRLFQEHNWIETEKGRDSDDERKKIRRLKPELIAWVLFIANLFQEVPKPEMVGIDENQYHVNEITFRIPDYSKFYFRTKTEIRKITESLIFGRAVAPASYGFERFFPHLVTPKQVNNTVESKYLLEYQPDLIDLVHWTRQALLSPYFGAKRLLEQGRVKIIGPIGTRAYSYLTIRRVDNKSPTDPRKIFFLQTSGMGVHHGNQIARQENLQVIPMTSPEELHERVQAEIEACRVARIIAQSPFTTIWQTKMYTFRDISLETYRFEDIDLLVAPTKSLKGKEAEVEALRKSSSNYLNLLYRQNYRFKIAEECVQRFRSLFSLHFRGSKVL